MKKYVFDTSALLAFIEILPHPERPISTKNRENLSKKDI